MRAARHEGNGLIFDADVPPPTPAPNEALVRIHWCGICGSDMQRLQSPPQGNRILGHECTGIVENVGAHAIRIGAPVVINPVVGCGACAACSMGTPQHCARPRSIGKEVSGGFGELVAVPAGNLYRLPSADLLRIGALADVAAVALHAIDQAPGSLGGKRVVVIGDGPIGAMIAALAWLQGATVELVGRHPQVAAHLPSGVSFRHVGSAAMTGDADVCFEAVGREQGDTLSLAIQRARPKGTVVVLGVYAPAYVLPLRAREMFKKELCLVGANSFDRSSTGADQFARAIEMLIAHRRELDALVTHQFPIERCAEALQAFRGKAGAIKVLMHF